MMKKQLLSAALVLATILTCGAKKNTEPTVLTIDGNPVGISEFEYLFNKNRSQQSVMTSRDEYLDMFITYKLKVADAIAAGIDTTAAFRREYNGYRHDLAAPYLTDSATYNRLIDEAYARTLETVDVSHIMLGRGRSLREDNANRATLDSLRTEIAAARADIDDVARRFSIDPISRRNNSAHMGKITGNGMYPYVIEKAAFDTPIGQLSAVLETDYGFHLIKVNGREKAPGTVLVEHILKLTEGMPEDAAAAQKNKIDSIYRLVKSGADFADMARRESEDPGSAKQGGRLDWFSTGRMVPEFEKVAFALADGEISEPFITSYGYHIIKKIGHRDVTPLEESRKQLEAMIKGDARSVEPRKAKIEQFRTRYGSTFNSEVFDSLVARIKKNGGYDTELMNELMTDNRVIYSIPGGKDVTVKNLVEASRTNQKIETDLAVKALRSNAEALENNNLVEKAVEDLPAQYPDYRNLLNEYRDGMLLFEISNRKVWNHANNDKKGLEEFFLANRNTYSWEKPKFKGYVVFATSDSIAREAARYLESNPVSADSLTLNLRKQYGKDIKVEKVIAAKGENLIIDHVGFGMSKPQPKERNRWNHYFAYLGRIIDNPEEAADVRGAVVGDYQAMLEEQWVKDLRSRHKVKVNKKVLKKVK